MSKNLKKEEAQDLPSETASPAKAKAQFVIDFKEGPIVAKVWLCDGAEGTKFLKYSLPRYYQAQTGKWIDRKDYFGRNEDDLISAIKQAAAFCNDHQNNPEQAIAAAAALSRPAPNGADSGVAATV